MAVVFATEAGVDRTSNGGYCVLPENIILKPELNGRSEDTDVTELSEDILSRGQLVAAIAYKNAEGWPVLIAGHRRLRAIVSLNKNIKDPEKKIKLKFNYSQVKTEEEALDLTVAENRNRTDCNVLDDSYNINVYITKFGKGIEEIAKKYFPGADNPEKLAKAVAWVKERQKLLELSPEAQDKLRKGEFSTSAAMQLSKLQPVAQNKLLKEKEKSGEKLKVKDVQEKVAEVQGKPQKPAKEIKDNTPSKLLFRFKALAELAGSLSAEVVAKDFGREYDEDSALELARQVLVICKRWGVPLETTVDSWAGKNQDLETALDDIA
jgi:ParB-like chromosome segregation protein Spo0J